MIENFGGTPVTMPVTEVYQSLQRGLIDATVVAWTDVDTYKYYEVAKFHMEAPISANSSFVFMNRDSCAKLSGKAKAALDKHAGEPFAKALGKMFDDSEDEARAKVRAMPDHAIEQVPEAELPLWKARVLAAYRTEIAKIREERKAGH